MERTLAAAEETRADLIDTHKRQGLKQQLRCQRELWEEKWKVIQDKTSSLRPLPFLDSPPIQGSMFRRAILGKLQVYRNAQFEQMERLQKTGSDNLATRKEVSLQKTAPRKLSVKSWG